MVTGSTPVACGDDGAYRICGLMHRGTRRRSSASGVRAAKDDLAEAGREAGPPTRDEAGARGGPGAAEAGEDEEEQVVGEGSDAVRSSQPGGTPAKLH